jgi:hypothetical protein
MASKTGETVLRVCRPLVFLIFLYSLSTGYLKNARSSIITYLALWLPQILQPLSRSTNRPVKIVTKPFFTPKAVGVLAAGLTAHIIFSTNSPIGYHLQSGWMNADIIPHSLCGAALYCFSKEILEETAAQTGKLKKKYVGGLSLLMTAIGGGIMEMYDAYMAPLYGELLDCATDEIGDIIGGLGAHYSYLPHVWPRPIRNRRRLHSAKVKQR